MRKINYVRLLISLAIPLVIGSLGSLFTLPNITSWYVGLNKPLLTPPNWVFGPAWTTLYILIGLALYLIWMSDVDAKIKKRAFGIFGLQIFLNFLWSILFFQFQLVFLAVLEILLLWVVILWNIIEFSKIRREAAWLMVPYLMWVSFAAYLTVGVWLLN